MHRRPFGKTGLKVTPIGLGLAALGRPGYITLGHADDLNGDTDVAAMQGHTHTVLDAAWAVGMRYFDAARSYGKAEQFLGSWLRARNIPVDAVTVGSKWGYTYTADWQIHADTHEVKEHSLGVLTRQRAETAETLGAYLNLYQVHSATLSSGILENTAVLTELARIKADGVRIGLSLSGPGQAETLRRALQVTVDGEPVFDAVQATWNLLEQSVGEALADAHDAGWGVIVKETLANGRLTPRNDDAAIRGLLDEQAGRLSATVDALALAAVLAQPWCDVALSGAAQIDHLQSNVRAVDVAWDDVAESALADLVEDAEVYWETRSNLEWN